MLASKALMGRGMGFEFPLCIRVPGCALNCSPQEAAGDGLSTRTSAACMADPAGVSGSWFRPGPALAVMGIWQVTRDLAIDLTVPAGTYPRPCGGVCQKEARSEPRGAGGQTEEKTRSSSQEEEDDGGEQEEKGRS